MILVWWDIEKNGHFLALTGGCHLPHNHHHDPEKYHQELWRVEIIDNSSPTVIILTTGTARGRLDISATKVALYSLDNLPGATVIKIIGVPHSHHLLESNLDMYRYTTDIQVNKLTHFPERNTTTMHAFSDSKTITLDTSKCYNASLATLLSLTPKNGFISLKIGQI